VSSLGADEVISTVWQDFQAQGFANFARRADSVIDTAGGKTQEQLFTLVNIVWQSLGRILGAPRNIVCGPTSSSSTSTLRSGHGSLTC
jgi:hypothetical protein